MKKIITAILLVTVLLSLSGCCFCLPSKEDEGKVSIEDRPVITMPPVLETQIPGNTEDIWVEETEAPTEIELPTESPTEPPVTENVVSLSQNGVQKRLNTFLSNFAETYMYEYPCTDYEMLQFAYIHAMINNDGKIYNDTTYPYMNEEDVNSILHKYFGETFPENAASCVYEYYTGFSTNYIEYDGQYYYFDNGAGESYAIVAVASKMVKNGNYYTVEYSVFMHDDTDAYMKPYYEMSYDQALRDSKLSMLYSGTAVVKDYQRDDKNWSYQLIELEANR